MMNRLRRGLLPLMVPSLLFCAQAPEGDLGGWVTYWNPQGGMTSLQSSKGRIADVLLFALHLDPQGNPITIRPERELTDLVRTAKSLGGKVWLTVVNDREDGKGKISLKDRGIMHTLMNDSTNRARHIASLTKFCQAYGVEGLDLDYESLDVSDRSNFSVFVAELAGALHERGFKLSVTLEPKSRESKSNGPGAADWSALGRAADQLQIMLYNLHYSKTAPGPAATNSWMSEVMNFAETQCERSKLRPALKVSGFEWGAKAREISYKDLQAWQGSSSEEPRRHPDGQTPSWAYAIGKEVRVAFCEDAASLKDKINFLHARGYPKVVLWSLGAEDPSLWSTSINSSSRLPKPIR